LVSEAQAGARTSGVKPGRNQAIDVLRGLCIVMMITGHAGTETHLNHGVHFLRFVSGAEGFVFLAGLVMGLVYRRKMETGPIMAAYRAIWRRAATIPVHCALVFMAVAGNGAFYSHADVPTMSTFSASELIGLTASLRLQPGHALNVLPLYVFLLAGAPLVFELLRRRMTGVVLMASIGTLVFMQYRPQTGAWVHESCGNAFPPLFWQGLFVPALCVGYHYTAIRDRFIAPRRRPLTIALVALCTGIAVASWVQTPTFEFYDHARWDLALFGRHPLRLGRVAYFLVAIGALYLVVQAALRRAAWIRPPLEALALLGRNSLYAFLTHIVVTLPLTAAIASRSPGFAAEAMTALVVVAVYLLARYQVGRPWVPN